MVQIRDASHLATIDTHTLSERRLGYFLISHGLIYSITSCAGFAGSGRYRPYNMVTVLLYGLHVLHWSTFYGFERFEEYITSMFHNSP